MKAALLDIKASIQINKTAEEVFEAIVDPKHMSNYFIATGNARLETGKDLIWKFPEFDIDVPIRCHQVKAHQYVSFYWDDPDGTALLVEMNLRPEGSGTVLTITEKSRKLDDEGIAWLKRNTEGWANFLACLKAYLEFGINLRKGAFDFMKHD